MQQLLAVQRELRRAPSNDSSSSEDGLVERNSRSARPTAPASTRPP